MIEHKQIMDMNISEKIRLMEWLWEDLSREENNLKLPDWHKGILDNRIAAIESGESRYKGWDSVKADILKQIQ